MVRLEHEPTRVWMHAKNGCMMSLDTLPPDDAEEYNRLIKSWPQIPDDNRRERPAWRGTLQTLARGYRAGVRFKKAFWRW